LHIVRSVTLPITAEQAFELLRHSATLVKVAAGMVEYDNADDFPAQWEINSTVNLRPRIWGIPQGDHFVEFVLIDADQQLLVTNEYGGKIKSWHHRMELKNFADRSCLYTDRIVIDAGLFTWVVWLFAKLFYRHRHRRWLRLLDEGKL